MTLNFFFFILKSILSKGIELFFIDVTWTTLFKFLLIIFSRNKVFLFRNIKMFKSVEIVLNFKYSCYKLLTFPRLNIFYRWNYCCKLWCLFVKASVELIIVFVRIVFILYKFWPCWIWNSTKESIEGVVGVSGCLVNS